MGFEERETTRGITGPDLQDWRAQNHTFEDIDAFLGNIKFSLGSDAFDTVRGACMGARVLPILGVQAALGRNFVPADERNGASAVVMLSDGLWRTPFASDRTIVRRTIRIDDKPYEVVGVAPAGFFFPDTDARLWIPSPCGLSGFESREVPLLHAVGRLRTGVSLRQAQTDLDAVNGRLAQAYPETNRGRTTGVFALRHVVIGKFERAL